MFKRFLKLIFNFLATKELMCESMKILTFGTILYKLKHPSRVLQVIYVDVRSIKCPFILRIIHMNLLMKYIYIFENAEILGQKFRMLRTLLLFEVSRIKTLIQTNTSIVYLFNGKDLKIISRFLI